MDKNAWQVAALLNIKIGAGMFGGKARIAIEDHKGDDYPNSAVSTVLLYMKEMEATPNILSASGESAGHPKDALKDGNPKTFWAADASGAQEPFEASATACRGSARARPGRLREAEEGPARDRRAHEDLRSAEHRGHAGSEVPATTGTPEVPGEGHARLPEVWPGSKPAIVLGDLDVMATSYEGSDQRVAISS